MTSAPLYAPANTVLDANGNGIASVGPLSAREVWQPTQVTVSANSNPVNNAQCKIYVGEDTTQKNYVDGCIDGSTGDSTTNLPRLVKVGQKVWAVWTNGDAFVQAFLTVTGTKDV